MKNPSKFVKLENDTTDKYGISVEKHFQAAGTHYPLHWHDFLEFEIILSGNAEHIYNGNRYPLQARSAYLMCHYDFHELYALTDVTLYTIHFKESLLPQEVIRYLDFNKFHCEFEENEYLHILERIRQLDQEMVLKRPLNAQIMQNIITELVIAMIRKSTAKDTLTAPQPVQQALIYINTHFKEKITLEEMATRLSFSPNYLGNLFKTQTGLSFHDYLNTLRLKYACSLLLSTNMTVKEVAYASGYHSIEYFMYVFRQKMQMTPSSYRQQSK